MLYHVSASALVLLAFLFALVSPVASQEQKRDAVTGRYPVPDLVMLVLVSQQMDTVSFSYSKIVKRDQAEAHLAKLLQETGWTANNVRIEDMKMMDGSATTTVEFNTLGTVNLESGGFPLAPIIKAFRDLGYLEVHFMVPQQFAFRGLRQFENKHVKITLNRGTNAYGYSVFVKDPNFDTLNLPMVQPERNPTRNTTEGNHANLIVSALIIALGLFVAMLVFFLTKRAAGSHTEH